MFSRLVHRTQEHSQSAKKPRHRNVPSAHSQPQAAPVTLAEHKSACTNPLDNTSLPQMDEDWDKISDILQKIAGTPGWENRYNISVSYPASERSRSNSPPNINNPRIQPEQLSIRDLCKRIHQTPTYSDARVLSIACYKEITGIPHEFLVARVCMPSAPDMWIRLERAADLSSKPSLMSRVRQAFSHFAPDDKAKIAAKESDLMSSTEWTIPMEKLIFNEDRLSLKCLALLLEAFVSEVDTYSLRKQNCFFFCSVILEALSRLSYNRVSVRNVIIGKDTRKRIRRKYLEGGLYDLAGLI